MKLIGILFALCLGATVSLASTGVLYDCDITQKRAGVDWISSKIAIVLTRDGNVVVSDAIILLVNKTPMQARVSRNTESKLAIRWTLNNVESADNQITPAFDYSAILSKKTHKISVHAHPEGFSNRFSGKGTCHRRTA